MNDPSTRKHKEELPCCIRLKVEVVYDLNFFEDIGEKNEAKSIARYFVLTKWIANPVMYMYPKKG